MRTTIVISSHCGGASGRVRISYTTNQKSKLKYLRLANIVSTLTDKNTNNSSVIHATANNVKIVNNLIIWKIRFSPIRFVVEPFFPWLGCNIPSAISTEPLSTCIVFGLGRLNVVLLRILGAGFNEPISFDSSRTLPCKVDQNVQ